MSNSLEAFHEEFFQDVHATADARGDFAEDAFFDIFCEHLTDAGELDTADRALYMGQRGIRVDGYGGDPAESDGVLNLIICDFNQSPHIKTLTAAELDASFSRVQKFLERAVDPRFANTLEETTAAFGLSQLVAARWPSVSKVRFFLVTNRLLSARVDGRPAGKFQHASVTFSVWDIERLQRYVVSGSGRESIDIALAGEFGRAVPALPAHLDEAGYEAYLLVLPGSQLAAIYDRWGARLLEQNVRCFLQARGNVNKGIRNTLENSPEMFFAYNNGITATAESIECRMSHDGLVVERMKNLQIVNGGQTTASIHAASKKKDANLSRVFVQMKLSIIPEDRTLDVVPKISEFANSQNRVNAADFFANHPFHIRLEEFSRRLFVPSPDGSFRQSKWFYERARGQYLDAKAYLTGAQKRKFDLEYPKEQVFSKTDLAKFVNLWRLQPHVVSKGAQKNFVNFAEQIGQEWQRQPDDFNEVFYRESIAKAIIFREVERLVTKQPWYQGGYRAQVVAYAIAKLAYDVQLRGRSLDFEAIWKTQTISPRLREAFTVAATAVHAVIVNAPSGISNVTEWAKRQGCWQRVMDLAINTTDHLKGELLSGDEKRFIKKSAAKEQKLLNGVEAQIEVVERGGPFWKSVREWGVSRKLLSQSEIGILDVASALPLRIPTEKQCLRVLETLEKLHGEGCKLGLEAP